MQCMTYEPSPSLIPWVVSVVDIGEEVMNIVQLIIQILKLCSALCKCAFCDIFKSWSWL